MHYVYTYLTLAKENYEVKQLLQEVKNADNIDEECLQFVQSLEICLYEILPTIREYAYSIKLQKFDYYLQTLKRITLLLLKFNLKDSKYAPTLLIWIQLLEQWKKNNHPILKVIEKNFFVLDDEIGEVYFSLFARITTNLSTKSLKLMPTYYRYFCQMNFI